MSADYVTEAFASTTDVKCIKKVRGEENGRVTKNDYIMEMEAKYNEVLASIENYDDAWEIGKKELLLKNAKRSFENAKKIVLDTLNSRDENVKRTAFIVKVEFKKNYDYLLVIRSLMIRVKKGTGAWKGMTLLEKKEVICGKEEDAALEIISKLDVMIQLQELKEREKQNSAVKSASLETTAKTEMEFQDYFIVDNIEDEYIEEKEVIEVVKHSQFIGEPIKLLIQKEMEQDESDDKAKA